MEFDFKEIKYWIKSKRTEAGHLYKQVARSPETMIPWFQQMPRIIAKPILNCASELLEPGLWSSGVRMRKLGRDRIWLEIRPIRLPYVTEPRPLLGPLLLAAEWSFRLLWCQQTHLQGAELKIISGEVQIDKSVTYPLWLRGELGSELINKVQIKLLKEGNADWEWTIALLNSKEIQVGEVRLKLEWQGQKSLPGSK